MSKKLKKDTAKRYQIMLYDLDVLTINKFAPSFRGNRSEVIRAALRDFERNQTK